MKKQFLGSIFGARKPEPTHVAKVDWRYISNEITQVLAHQASREKRKV